MVREGRTAVWAGKLMLPLNWSPPFKCTSKMAVTVKRGSTESPGLVFLITFTLRRLLMI